MQMPSGARQVPQATGCLATGRWQGGCGGGLVPALSWGLSQDIRAPIMNQVDCSHLAEDSIWKEGQREELASGWLFQD